MHKRFIFTLCLALLGMLLASPAPPRRWSCIPTILTMARHRAFPAM